MTISAASRMMPRSPTLLLLSPSSRAAGAVASPPSAAAGPRPAVCRGRYSTLPALARRPTAAAAAASSSSSSSFLISHYNSTPVSRMLAAAALCSHPLPVGAAAAAGFHNSSRSENSSESGLPFKTLRRILVWQRAVSPPRHRSSPSGKRQNSKQQSEKEKQRKNVADILTILSQLILVGTSGLIIFAVAMPEVVANRMEEYKQRLTDRRHERMLDFMESHRPYITGGIQSAGLSTANSSSQDLLFAKDIYHEAVAEDVKEILFGSLKQYGIIVGPPGSGKSHLLRRLVGEQQYYSFLSMGLICGVKSLVDALSEEVGYDFDEWSERMLSSYLFNGVGNSFPEQLDKLAFLLDEFEEACWKLKFDPKRADSPRPILVLDDIDSLDFDNVESRKALRMLFNAAKKWAREETCHVVFTMSDATFAKRLEGLVPKDTLDAGRQYTVGNLTPAAADRFLEKNLPPTATVLSKKKTAKPPTPAKVYATIRNTVGTRLTTLVRVCEEATRTAKPIEDILAAHVDAAVGEIATALLSLDEVLLSADPKGAQPSSASSAAASTSLPKHGTAVFSHPSFLHQLRIRWRRADIFYMLDKISSHPLQEGCLSGATKALLWNEAMSRQVAPLMEHLIVKGVLSADGQFASDLLRNAYRKYRRLRPTYPSH